MTDVWKSNARKFCEICKVWFADNRVSIEHHESGRRHKDAIQAKLRELGRQRSLKEKQQSDLQRTLAAMESAARKSMSSDSTDLPCAPVGPALKPRTFMDPRAHGSSVAAMAVEMARRKREKEEAANLATKSQHWKDEDEDEQVLLPKKEPSIEKTEHNEEIVWAETTTDEGVPYYFQIYTGETLWEVPSKFYTAREYASKWPSLAGVGQGSGDQTAASPAVIDASAAPARWDIRSQAENGSDEMKQNRTSRRANLHPATQSKSTSNHDIETKAICGSVPIDIADIPPPGSYVPAATCSYKTAPVEQDNGQAIATAAAFRLEDHDDIPLPPPPQENAGDEKDVRMEPVDYDNERSLTDTIKMEQNGEGDAKGASEESASDPVTMMKAESSECAIVKPKPEHGAEVDLTKDASVEHQANRTSTPPHRVSRPSPYGEWRKVEKPVDPPKIDYQLPTEEEGRKLNKEEPIKPEDIVEFSEKTATITRKRAKIKPVEFKKRRVNLSTRKRDDDD